LTVVDPVPKLLQRVSQRLLRRHLFHLCKDPLPFRKLNCTLPGHAKSTLEEADDFIQERLESWGYRVEREACLVQAFRCDVTKVKAHQYGTPRPDDRWYVAHNLYARKLGSAHPDEIILLVAHKDSQSWVDCPGAYDNAVGTVANLEIARVLARCRSRRSIWFLFCNEEHWPWTSVTAARNARIRGDRLIAIFNTDSVGGKRQADVDAGRKTNVTGYTRPEGEPLADLMAAVNETYKLGLIQSKARRKSPGDDDGSFIKEGFPAAVINLGSIPYGDPNYHLESDGPELVDIPNVRMATQAVLAAVVKLDGRNPGSGICNLGSGIGAP
jgi:hypothetical protein